MIQRYQLVVDGRRVPAADGRMLQSTNPYTGEVWAEIPDAGPEDVAQAVAAANRCFQTVWRDTPGVKRAALMHKLAGLIEASADRLSAIESRRMCWTKCGNSWVRLRSSVLRLSRLPATSGNGRTHRQR